MTISNNGIRGSLITTASPLQSFYYNDDFQKKNISILPQAEVSD
jgi:hypothetical protein